MQLSDSPSLSELARARSEDINTIGRANYTTDFATKLVGLVELEGWGVMKAARRIALEFGMTEGSAATMFCRLRERARKARLDGETGIVQPTEDGKLVNMIKDQETFPLSNADVKQGTKPKMSTTRSICTAAPPKTSSTTTAALTRFQPIALQVSRAHPHAAIVKRPLDNEKKIHLKLLQGRFLKRMHTGADIDLLSIADVVPEECELLSTQGKQTSEDEGASQEFKAFREFCEKHSGPGLGHFGHAQVCYTIAMAIERYVEIDDEDESFLGFMRYHLERISLLPKDWTVHGLETSLQVWEQMPDEREDDEE